jgi:ribonuclease HI
MPRGANVQELHLTVFTDGGCVANGKRNAICGSGVWIEEDHPLNAAIRVPRPRQSNQIGELVAVISALQTVDNFAPITIISDSLYVIEGATKHLPKWEGQGYIDIANAPEWKAPAHQLRKRTATTTFQWQKGHAGVQGNEEADKKATEGLLKASPDEVDLTVPMEWEVPGARLNAITQRLAYKAIRNKNKNSVWTSVTINLDTARAAIEDHMGTEETDESIWKGCHNAAMLNKEKQFFWKAMHRAHKCGPYWERREGREQWAECQACPGHIESITHVLIECTANRTRETAWAIAKDLWPGPEADWPELSTGMILVIGSLKTTNDMERQSQRSPNQRNQGRGGSSRLLNLIMATTAFLVWKL